MNQIVLEGLKLLLLGCTLAFFWAMSVKVMMNFFIPTDKEHERKIKELLGE